MEVGFVPYRCEWRKANPPARLHAGLLYQASHLTLISTLERPFTRTDVRCPSNG